MRAVLLASCFIALWWIALPTASLASTGAPTGAQRSEAPARFNGTSTATFHESLAALESGLGDAARLALHMKLAQVRAKLAEQRGRPLTDAEFAAALDGKTLADLDALADAAPTHITIDIETSDDT